MKIVGGFSRLAGSLLVLLMVAQPVLADSYSDQGMLLYNRGDFKNAGRYFAQSLRAQPNNPTALYYSALCCRELGNESACETGLNTVIQVFPTSPEATLAREQLNKPVERAPYRSKSKPVSGTGVASAGSTSKKTALKPGPGKQPQRVVTGVQQQQKH